MQIAISGGAASTSVSIDDMKFSVQYPKGGTFGATIDRLVSERDRLYDQAMLQIGPVPLMGEM